MNSIGIVNHDRSPAITSYANMSNRKISSRVTGQRRQKEVEHGIHAASVNAVVERVVEQDRLLIRTMKRHKCRAPAVTCPLPSRMFFTVALALGLLAATCVGAAETSQTFATPEEAVQALAAASAARDSAALHAIFGPAAAELSNPDRVQATNEFARFADAYSQTNYLRPESATTRVLVIGTNDFPFPVPIVQKDGRWFFDTAAGKEELLNRRIGQNEISTLSAIRAYVDAQRIYSQKDHDGDRVLEFAQKIISTPGLKDGLFWSPEIDGEISPLGPYAADAADEGYRKRSPDAGEAPQPFHGYFFKILTRQGKHAPGGKYSYIINGNMIGGFSLVAWPADHGNSGIMTFIVNQQGLVYQKDLGPKTASVAEAMKEYDPDKTWALSPD